MGLAWEPQARKLREHPILQPTVTELTTVADDGKNWAMTALPLTRLNFWLATIQPNKIPSPETRARVIAYQERCADSGQSLITSPKAS